MNLDPNLRKEIVGIIQDLFTHLEEYEVWRHTDYFLDMHGDRKRIRFIKIGMIVDADIVNYLNEPIDNCIRKSFEYRGSIWDITNDVLLFVNDNV